MRLYPSRAELRLLLAGWWKVGGLAAGAATLACGLAESSVLAMAAGMFSLLFVASAPDYAHLLRFRALLAAGVLGPVCAAAIIWRLVSPWVCGPELIVTLVGAACEVIVFCFAFRALGEYMFRLTGMGLTDWLSPGPKNMVVEARGSASIVASLTGRATVRSNRELGSDERIALLEQGVEALRSELGTANTRFQREVTQASERLAATRSDLQAANSQTQHLIRDYVVGDPARTYCLLGLALNGFALTTLAKQVAVMIR